MMAVNDLAKFKTLSFSFLSQIIAKLKKGESVDDAEVDESTQVELFGLCSHNLFSNEA